MGQLRFQFLSDQRLDSATLERVYMVGIDTVPWVAQVEPTELGFDLHRQQHDSGCVLVPWKVQGFGEPLLSTANLMERERPYLLPVEIARGTLNRLRNQRANWEAGGFVASERVGEFISQASSAFAKASTSQQDPAVAAGHAQTTLEFGLQGISLIAEEYTAWALPHRCEPSGKLTSLLGASLADDLPDVATFCGSFNSVVLPCAWSSIEPDSGNFQWEDTDKQLKWCHENGLKIISEPLLQLDAFHLPQWIYLWDGQFEELLSAIVGYVEKVVDRYRDKLHIWQCAGRLNFGGELTLSEEERLKIAVAVIETIRRNDPRTPVVFSLDRPWADYMGQQHCDLSPLHFADALVRANLGLAGISLELNLSYASHGSPPQDLLAIGRLIDVWSQLGIPLLVFLTIPSSESDDAQAKQKGSPLCGGIIDSLCEMNQQILVEKILPLLMAKPAVQGVFWNQWDDSQPHDFAHGGMLNANKLPKPALDAFTKFRQEFME
jgi:hypothetical protein